MHEDCKESRCVQELKPKERRAIQAQESAYVNWRESIRRKPGEEFMKNLAVAASLVICAAVLRSGAIPQLNSTTDAVMTAVTSDTLIDEQLGKLSFVSVLFPEATLVFGEQTDPSLAMPVSAGAMVHAWSEAEPYTAWRSGSREVVASMDGEVTGIFHGNGEERIVQIKSSDDLTCLYGNLAECAVQEGDAVKAGDTLGVLLTDADCLLEVRRDGFSIDPASLMGGEL